MWFEVLELRKGFEIGHRRFSAKEKRPRASRLSAFVVIDVRN
jgi:hypothetical protein